MEIDNIRPIVTFRKPDGRLVYSITHRWSLLIDPTINKILSYRIDSKGQLTAVFAEQALRYWPVNPTPHVRDWNPRGYHPSQDINPATLLAKITDIITPN